MNITQKHILLLGGLILSTLTQFAQADVVLLANKTEASKTEANGIAQANVEGWESIFKQDACIQYDDAHLFPFTIRDYGKKLKNLIVENIQAVRPTVVAVSNGDKMTTALRVKFGNQTPIFNSHYSIQQSVALTVAASIEKTSSAIQLAAPYIQWKDDNGSKVGVATHTQFSNKLDNIQFLQKNNPLEAYKIIDTELGRSTIEIQIKPTGTKTLVIYRCQSTHRSKKNLNDIVKTVRGEALEVNANIVKP